MMLTALATLLALFASYRAGVAFHQADQSARHTVEIINRFPDQPAFHKYLHRHDRWKYIDAATLLALSMLALHLLITGPHP